MQGIESKESKTNDVINLIKKVSEEAEQARLEAQRIESERIEIEKSLFKARAKSSSQQGTPQHKRKKNDLMMSSEEGDSKIKDSDDNLSSEKAEIEVAKAEEGRLAA